MSLKPILNSPLDRPAKTVADVTADVHDQVASALHHTDARIATLTDEITDKQHALHALAVHRAALIAWLDQSPPQMITDQRYCEAEPRLLPGPSTTPTT